MLSSPGILFQLLGMHWDLEGSLYIFVDVVCCVLGVYGGGGGDLWSCSPDGVCCWWLLWSGMAEPFHDGEFRCIVTHSTANKAVSRLHLFVSRQELKKPSAKCHAMQLESALYTCSLKNHSVRLWAMLHYIMDRFVHFGVWLASSWVALR